MSKKLRIAIFIAALALVTLSCQAISGISGPAGAATTAPNPTPAATATALPAIPVEAGSSNPDEPVYIQGGIPYSSPFFLNTISEPFVLLEDEARIRETRSRVYIQLREPGDWAGHRSFRQYAQLRPGAAFDPPGHDGRRGPEW